MRLLFALGSLQFFYKQKSEFPSRSKYLFREKVASLLQCTADMWGFVVLQGNLPKGQALPAVVSAKITYSAWTVPQIWLHLHETHCQWRRFSSITGECCSYTKKWLLHWGVEEPWLNPKAGIPPVFWSKKQLMSMLNGQPSWLEALCASLKPFLVVMFKCFLAGL